MPSNDLRSENSIVKSMDVIFTILVFYTFFRWSSMETIFSKILFIFTCLVIVNDWLSFRATAEIYTGGMFICDLVIVFLAINMLSPLSHNSLFGYDINYWLYFGGLLLVYSIWDAVVASQPATNSDRKKSLKKWMFVMLVNAIFSFLTYYAQFTYTEHINISSSVLFYVVTWIPILPVGMFTITLYYWNSQKLTWLQRQLPKRKNQNSF